MVSTREFLERLRLAGTPGAPALSGVPADRTGERSAELQGVLASLDAVQDQARAIRAQAEAEAARRRRAAVDRAAAVLAAARRDAETERRTAADRGRVTAAHEVDAVAAAAAAEAAEVARRAAERRDGLVDRIVAEARHELDRLVGPRP